MQGIMSKIELKRKFIAVDITEREIIVIDTIDILLDYYEKGSSSSLFNCLQEFSAKDVRVVVIEILGWLKLEHKRELWAQEEKQN